MKNRIGSFVSSIVTFVLTIVGLIFLWDYLQALPTGNMRGFAVVVTLPILFILAIVLLALVMSTITTSIISISSRLIAIRVISIIILILTIACVVIALVMFEQALNFGG